MWNQTDMDFLLDNDGLINMSITDNMTDMDNMTHRIMPAWRTNPSFEMGIIKWVFPVIIMVGTVGNVLSFVVLTRRPMVSSPVSCYLSVLAVADTLVLYVSALQVVIRVWTGIKLLHLSVVTCKIMKYLWYSCSYFSAWTVVAMTTDRFLAVWFPFKASKLCSLRRARLTVVGLASLILVGNLYHFWTTDLFMKFGGMTCSTQDLTMSILVPWLNLIIYSIIPFTFVLIFNVLIAVALFQTRPSTRSTTDVHKLSCMLLAVSFAWLVLSTPYTVIDIVRHVDICGRSCASTRIVIICYMFAYLNHSINFFLYCLTGRKFRNQLIKMCCCYTPNIRTRYQAVIRLNKNGNIIR